MAQNYFRELIFASLCSSFYLKKATACVNPSGAVKSVTYQPARGWTFAAVVELVWPWAQIPSAVTAKAGGLAFLAQWQIVAHATTAMATAFVLCRTSVLAMLVTMAKNATSAWTITERWAPGVSSVQFAKTTEFAIPIHLRATAHLTLAVNFASSAPTASLALLVWHCRTSRLWFQTMRLILAAILFEWKASILVRQQAQRVFSLAFFPGSEQSRQ